jgi:hypothetical protein
VIIREPRLDETRSEIRKVIADNWRGSAPAELHFSGIPAAKLAGVTEALAEIFLREVDDAVCMGGINLDFCRHLLRCEAEFNRAKERPIQTNIADLLADKGSHPGRKLLILTSEELITHVGIDSLVRGSSLKVVHDRKHRQWMNEALQKSFDRSQQSIRLVASELYGQELCPSMSFTVAASETDSCLWLSDWIAWEFGAWLRDDRDLSPAFKKVQSRLRFFAFGNAGQKTSFDGPGGHEIARYPDRPREIASIV